MSRIRRSGCCCLAIAGMIAAGCSGGDGAEPADAAADSPPATAEPTDEATTELEPEPADAASPTEPVTEADPTRCDPGAVDPAEPVTVRVWHALNGDVVNYLEILVGRFEADNPGIRLEIEKVVSDYPAAIDRLREAPDDELPDVIIGSNQTVRLQADSGRFIPIDECNGGETPDQLTDLLPVIERTYTVEGTLWAAPFNVSGPVMLYDRKRWDRAGLDPATPPRTLDELEAAVRQLVDSGEASVGALLYDRSALWFLDQAAARADRLLVEPGNGRDGLDVDRVVFATPEAVDVLTRLAALRSEGYVEWLGLNASGSEDLARMVHPTEPAGVTFNTSAVLGDISRLLGTGQIPDVELGVAPLPGVTGATDGSLAGGGAFWILDRDDPAQAGAAWKFVDWFTQPPIIAEIAAYTGYVPTTVRAAEHPTTQAHWLEWPQFRVAYDQIAAGPDSAAGAGLQLGPMVEVLRNLELAAAYSIDTGSDPATELRRAEESSLEILRLYADSLGTPPADG